MQTKIINPFPLDKIASEWCKENIGEYEMPFKLSCNQFRNIGNVYYECWSSNTQEFNDEIEKCKTLNLRYRIIKNSAGHREFFREISR